MNLVALALQRIGQPSTVSVRRVTALLVCAAAMGAGSGSALAHASVPSPAQPDASSGRSSAERTGTPLTAPAMPLPAWLSPNPNPIAAHYEIRFAPSDPSHGPSSADWYFQREAQRVRLIKGDLEELWERDGRGWVSFERTFHADHRRVYYSRGELLALNVKPEWTALLTFMDARDLSALQPVDGAVANEGKWRLRGVAVDGSRVDVSWDAVRQLPTRIERATPKGRLSFHLVESKEQVPPQWPLSTYRGVDYERLDSADLGDMEYDPFARKAEEVDLKVGWREPHAH